MNFIFHQVYPLAMIKHSDVLNVLGLHSLMLALLNEKDRDRLCRCGPIRWAPGGGCTVRYP